MIERELHSLLLEHRNQYPRSVELRLSWRPLRQTVSAQRKVSAALQICLRLVVARFDGRNGFNQLRMCVPKQNNLQFFGPRINKSVLFCFLLLSKGSCVRRCDKTKALRHDILQSVKQRRGER